MKKRLYLLTMISLIYMVSCGTDPVSEVSDQIEQQSQDIKLNREQALQNLHKTDIDSLILNRPDMDARGGKVEFKNDVYYMTSNSWVGLQYSKSTLAKYKIYIDIEVTSGSYKTYAFGYDANGGGYRQIRSASKSTYISSNDLASYEEDGYVGVYAYTTGSLRVKFSYERIDENTSGGSGQTLSVTFNNSNPSSGTAGQTNFNFSTKINSGNPNNGIIRFYAPDQNYYPFSMIKSGSYYNYNKVLSQVGTYYYRYEITDGSTNKISQWATIQVSGSSGNGSTGDFGTSCISSYDSSCKYAKSDNAFYATANNQDLRGQCTWYSYGRVIELVDQGKLPSTVKTKFKNAFWGTSSRHARYWPSKLGGSWYDTNSSVLPQNKRKKGMIAVWVFGSYGHVGFVEEISADGSKYRLSDFNRSNDLKKKDKWYSFSGTEDKLGGVYPRFLDLNTL